MGDEVSVIPRDALTEDIPTSSNSSAVSGIFMYKGIHRTPFPEGHVAIAGDCVTLSGVPDDIAVGDTVTGCQNPVVKPLSTPPLAPPTLAMDWSANQGPLAGKDADSKHLAPAKLQQRLKQETDNNVTLSIEPKQDTTIGRYSIRRECYLPPTL